MSDPNDVTWEDVQEAAAKMFDVWVDGTELEWAKEAWTHLSAAGLTRGTTILEITTANLRLLTLSIIYQEFCGLAWDTNPETPVDFLAEDLQIDPVALGILAGSDGTAEFENFDDDYDLREAALITVTKRQKPAIFQCLKAAYGSDIKLYSRLWHTRNESLEDDMADTAEEFEITPPNGCAIQYVLKGFH
jgi:hypothetical protein